MANKSFLIGGKLGDFIHGLVICKYVYEQTQTPVNVYISNIGDIFETSLENTYNELKPILEKQEWLNSFEIFNTQSIDYNLGNFRQSPLLYTTNWNNLYLKTYIDNNIECLAEYSWIKMDNKTPDLKDALILNRSLFPKDDSKVLPFYEKIFEKYDKRYFVCFRYSQYEAFPLKDYVVPYQIDNLYDMFTAISSGEMFISDLTGTFSIATALNVPRLLEISSSLEKTRDIEHYRDDTNLYKNFLYF